MIDGVRAMIDAEKALKMKNGNKSGNNEESKKSDLDAKIEQLFSEKAKYEPKTKKPNSTEKKLKLSVELLDYRVPI